ncbi:hypothetical protein STEG23_024893 [Scotinomys teguina]
MHWMKMIYKKHHCSLEEIDIRNPSKGPVPETDLEHWRMEWRSKQLTGCAVQSGVISRVKLNFPFPYPGQYHLNKQTEHSSLRHVYRMAELIRNLEMLVVKFCSEIVLKLEQLNNKPDGLKGVSPCLAQFPVQQLLNSHGSLSRMLGLKIRHYFFSFKAQPVKLLVKAFTLGLKCLIKSLIEKNHPSSYQSEVFPVSELLVSRNLRCFFVVATFNKAPTAYRFFIQLGTELLNQQKSNVSTENRKSWKCFMFHV